MRSWERPEITTAYEHDITKLSRIEEALYRMLVPRLEADAIDPRSLTYYDKKLVTKDLARTAELKAKFRARAEEDPRLDTAIKRGRLFEAIVADQIEQSNWFGESATHRTASEFDDYVNHVDGIVEFEDEGTQTHLALAVDVTKSTQHIEEKLNDIRHSILSGKLTEVRYFTSHTQEGSLKNVPRVIVGASQHTIEHVAQLIFTFEATRKSAGAQNISEETKRTLHQRFEEARNELEKHPLQFALLLEIQTQLRAFHAYAEKVKKPEVATQYARVLGIVDAIIEHKKEAMPEHNILTEDPVVATLLERTAHFGQ